MIQRYEIAALDRDLCQPFFFLLRPIAPKNIIRLAHRRHFFDPLLDMWIRGYGSS